MNREFSESLTFIINSYGIKLVDETYLQKKIVKWIESIDCTLIAMFGIGCMQYLNPTRKKDLY